jgi:HlyD family secretion protein
LSLGIRNDRVGRSWRRLAGVVFGLASAGLGLFWLTRPGAHSKEIGSKSAMEAREQSVPSVDVVRPKPGGIQRTIQQPASIHAFESVDLYAMISGYLKTQEVDIGSQIKKGEVLAEINVPRDAKDVEQGAAQVAQARAHVVQSEAQIKMAEAQRDAVAAAARQAESDVDRLVALRELARKQLARVQSLAIEKAVDQRLVDEQQGQFDAAVASERTSEIAVLTAKARTLAAQAEVEKAKADEVDARAMLGVAEAHLDRTKVNLAYAKIVAPFDGVVTHRTFHPGALIRSAIEGGQQVPLLTVKRTDIMRVVVLVPDRDVVLTRVGDPAVVNVDALDGQSFKGTLARIARAEDAERMMRVEIDLPNPSDVLFDGMYGKAIITLGQDARSFAVPSSAIVEHTGHSGGVVFVVRDGIARRAEIKLGGDNGSQSEVLSGIGPDDLVILPSGTPLEDGMRVHVSAEPQKG